MFCGRQYVWLIFWKIFFSFSANKLPNLLLKKKSNNYSKIAKFPNGIIDFGSLCLSDRRIFSYFVLSSRISLSASSSVCLSISSTALKTFFYCIIRPNFCRPSPVWSVNDGAARDLLEPVVLPALIWPCIGMEILLILSFLPENPLQRIPGGFPVSVSLHLHWRTKM